MVAPAKRRMKYKHKKTPSGTKREYFKSKHKKGKCAITGKKLAGVVHGTKTEMRKYSKTEKRPSAPFGGVLSGEARHEVFVEFAKVAAGTKKIEDVGARHKKYVLQAMEREGIKSE
jgi:ribosomal protein L34E